MMLDHLLYRALKNNLSEMEGITNSVIVCDKLYGQFVLQTRYKSEKTSSAIVGVVGPVITNRVILILIPFYF